MLQPFRLREKLPEKLIRAVRIIFHSPRLTSSLFIIFLFVMVSVFGENGEFKKSVKTAKSQTGIIAKKLSSAPSQAKFETKPTVTVLEDQKNVISGEVSEKKIAPTSTPTLTSPANTGEVAGASIVSDTASSVSSSSNSDLLLAVNAFRSSNGVASLNGSDSLCNIAGKRLSELIAVGNLDSHAGFNKYFSGQTEFNAMGEVIFQSSKPKPADYVVGQGWAKSTAGHRENMLDPKWNYGCGATNGYFSVFNFGKK